MIDNFCNTCVNHGHIYKKMHEVCVEILGLNLVMHENTSFKLVSVLYFVILELL
jgi:hypothetical protein